MTLLAALFFWFFLSLIVGVLAHNRGRVGFAWFALSVLLSPLLTGLLVLALRDLSTPAPTSSAALPVDGPQSRCPYCRELIRTDARKCKHCGSTLASQPPRA